MHRTFARVAAVALLCVMSTQAVRALQIDRRLSLAYQMQILSKIPLAH